MELNQIYTRLVSIKEDYEVAQQQFLKGDKASAEWIGKESTKRFTKLLEDNPDFDAVIGEVITISKILMNLSVLGVNTDASNEESSPYN